MGEAYQTLCISILTSWASPTRVGRLVQQLSLQLLSLWPCSHPRQNQSRGHFLDNSCLMEAPGLPQSSTISLLAVDVLGSLSSDISFPFKRKSPDGLLVFQQGTASQMVSMQKVLLCLACAFAYFRESRRQAVTWLSKQCSPSNNQIIVNPLHSPYPPGRPL